MGNLCHRPAYYYCTMKRHNFNRKKTRETPLSHSRKRLISRNLCERPFNPSICSLSSYVRSTRIESTHPLKISMMKKGPPIGYVSRIEKPAY